LERLLEELEELKRTPVFRAGDNVEKILKEREERKRELEQQIEEVKRNIAYLPLMMEEEEKFLEYFKKIGRKVIGGLNFDSMTMKFEDFQKIDLRIGKILKAEKVEKSEKLLKLVVDLGDEKRQLVAGLEKFMNRMIWSEKKLLLWRIWSQKI
jgi:hypothetical protein